MTQKIPLDEALQDYTDNEEDILMMELFQKNKWNGLNPASVRVMLPDAYNMREAIAKVITDQGGTVPPTTTEQVAGLQAEINRLQLEIERLKALAEELENHEA